MRVCWWDIGCAPQSKDNRMKLKDLQEQIQEDILSYFDSVAFVHHDHGRDDLCQIVVDNFGKYRHDNGVNYEGYGGSTRAPTRTDEDLIHKT